MHVNESAENYLETILMLSQKLPVVRSVDVATELNFKKSSVSVAMKKLRENHHIVVSPEGYISLTESGKEIADRIYERHTLPPPGWSASEWIRRQPQRMPAASNMSSALRALRRSKSM